MFNIQINKRLQDIKGCSSDFGGVSIIAIGDLFQLQPVFDGYVFEDLQSEYGALATNLWEKHFEMFELKEIMRQRESREFAEVLNRLREGIHTDNDLNIFRARIISDCEGNYPRNAPHIFIQNNRVDNFNLTVYNSASGRKYAVKAVDSIIGAQSEEFKQRVLREVPDDPPKTMQLLSCLKVAETERTEVCQNIRLDDGLTNGAGNVVKYVQLLRSERAEGIIWVQFDHQEVGQKVRHENRHLYGNNIDVNWTPIKPVCATFNVGRSKAVQILRKQFPLRPSAGKTVHRSQGDTETEIVVDLNTKRAIPHIHYVALSRVTRIEGLHIKCLNEEKICVSTKVTNEMNRLRTVGYLDLCVQFLGDISTEYTKIVFLNARSLHKHLDDVRGDINLKVAEVNITAESRLWVFDRDEKFEVDGFSLFRNDEQTHVHSCRQRPHGGTAVYIRESNPCIDQYPKRENCFGIEVTIVKLRNLPNVVIAGIHRSPRVPVTQLYQALAHVHSLMPTDVRHVILTDFNIDWFDDLQRSSLFSQIIPLYGYRQHIKTSTTDYRTTTDLILAM